MVEPKARESCKKCNRQLRKGEIVYGIWDGWMCEDCFWKKAQRDYAMYDKNKEEILAEFDDCGRSVIER